MQLKFYNKDWNYTIKKGTDPSVGMSVYGANSSASKLALHFADKTKKCNASLDTIFQCYLGKLRLL